MSTQRWTDAVDGQSIGRDENDTRYDSDFEGRFVPGTNHKHVLDKLDRLAEKNDLIVANQDRFGISMR